MQAGLGDLLNVENVTTGMLSRGGRIVGLSERPGRLPATRPRLGMRLP